MLCCCCVTSRGKIVFRTAVATAVVVVVAVVAAADVAVVSHKGHPNGSETNQFFIDSYCKKQTNITSESLNHQ